MNGPGGIVKGSYDPTQLGQDQRNWLYQQFGHSGDAPVGYGGEHVSGDYGMNYSNMGNGQYGLNPADLAQHQQDQYKQATDTAIGGLKQRSTDLQGQYNDLLSSVKGIYQPVINQTTASAGAEEARRGLSPDSFLSQQQVQGALQPIYGAEAGNQQQILQGSVSDINQLASGIAGLQTGVAGTQLGIPLQYGSLSLQQQALPSQIALAAAQARQANTGANFITVPNLGVYDLATKSFVGGGAGASPGALTGVGGLFKTIP